MLGSLALSLMCVLAGFASAFPFTYPTAFPFASSTPLPSGPDRMMTPFLPTTAPPPTSFQVGPSNGRGQGGDGDGDGDGGGEVGVVGGKVWCIGKPAADEQMLLANIAYACEEGGVDCTDIQPGGACFSPRSIIHHASFVMNMYYQKNQRNWWTCHFNSTGLVVFADPSFGDCIYSPQ